jgi:Rieske Fe-S protein
MSTPSPTRRTLLRGGGLAALALGGAGLAACAGAEPAAPPAGPPGDTGTPAGGGTPADDSAGGGTTVDVAEVPVGGGVVLDDADYVVTQPADGEFHAFSKICTHQGCPVGGVAEDGITCFCHGSVFSPADGSVLEGPATEPLAETPVRVEGGRVTIG